MKSTYESKSIAIELTKAVIIALPGSMKNKEDIFAEISQHSGVVRNNGGGFFNHNLFWEVMSPSGKENESLQIHQDIEKQFGSMDSFKDLFNFFIFSFNTKSIKRNIFR